MFEGETTACLKTKLFERRACTVLFVAAGSPQRYLTSGAHLPALRVSSAPSNHLFAFGNIKKSATVRFLKCCNSDFKWKICEMVTRKQMGIRLNCTVGPHSCIDNKTDLF